MQCNALNILQQLAIHLLHMLMMGDMRIKNRHLTAADTGTHIAHAVVITDGRVLVVRISITRLSSVPHDGVRILGIAADTRTTTRSGDHLVAVERQHAKLTERTEHLTVETRDSCRTPY